MLGSPMAGPDLSVVCRNCGSEVSPYVTECPYCGTRLRKRAPRIEREGDEIKVKEGRREKKLRRTAERRQRTTERRAGFERLGSRREELATRPLATVALIALPAVAYILMRAGVLPVEDFAILGPPDSEPWRYVTAPFAVPKAGLLFICGVVIAAVGPALERRLGTIPVVILGLACGALGMLAAVGMDSVIGDDFPLAAGPHAIALGLLAAYVVVREPERRADPDDSYDPIAVAVAAAVLLAVPIFFSLADAWAGFAGATVGALCGLSATMGRRGRA
jgi:membrane associated rhomboid family serine protease